MHVNKHSSYLGGILFPSDFLDEFEYCVANFLLVVRVRLDHLTKNRASRFVESNGRFIVGGFQVFIRFGLTIKIDTCKHMSESLGLPFKVLRNFFRLKTETLDLTNQTVCLLCFFRV